MNLSSRLAALLCLAPVALCVHSQESVSIDFLANEGVLVSQGSTVISVDGLFDRHYEQFGVLPDQDLDDAIAGRGRFAGIDALLATHEHLDHFNPGLTDRALASQPDLIFLGTGASADQLTESRDNNDDRALSVFKGRGATEVTEIGSATVYSIGMQHTGRHTELESVGYAIYLPGSVRVIHLGDALLTETNLRPFGDLPAARTTVLIVPFFQLDPSSIQRARDVFDPDEFVTAHIPPGEFDRIAGRVRELDGGIVILGKPGDRLAVEPQ